MQILIYVLIFSLFLLIGYLQYSIVKLKKETKENNAKRIKEFLDTGKAVTETLQAAFDNIKIVNQKHERLNKNFKELEGKFYNFTSHEKRIMKQTIQNTANNKNFQKNTEK
jgi:hypothetical protein